MDGAEFAPGTYLYALEGKVTSARPASSTSPADSPVSPDDLSGRADIAIFAPQGRQLP